MVVFKLRDMVEQCKENEHQNLKLSHEFSTPFFHDTTEKNVIVTNKLELNK